MVELALRAEIAVWKTAGGGLLVACEMLLKDTLLDSIVRPLPPDKGLHNLSNGSFGYLHIGMNFVGV